MRKKQGNFTVDNLRVLIRVTETLILNEFYQIFIYDGEK